MDVVGRQRRSQSGGRCLRFLRRFGVDHHRQQVGELWELSLESGGLLSPRQAFGEHLVGIGANPEVACRVNAGKCRDGYRDQDNQHRMPSAEVHQADEQALKSHSKPKLLICGVMPGAIVKSGSA